MKKVICALCLGAFVATNVYAAEGDESTANIRLNVKRIGLEMSSTDVQNAELYQDSPNSKLSADSETVIKGVFDAVVEYEQETYQWNNGLQMEYGKTKLKPAEGEETTTENTDRIWLYTDINAKMWKYNDSDIGPFASIGYQTEFTANNDAPRTKIVRGMEGIKMFNGENIKELYLAAVEEYDFTYSGDETAKLAYEIGMKSEYPLRDGVKFQLDGYFRDYVYFSNYVGTDFSYELGAVGRMDVKLNDMLSLAPYVNYFMAKARETDKRGSNFMIGLALTYSDLFDF